MRSRRAGRYDDNAKVEGGPMSEPQVVGVIVNGTYEIAPESRNAYIAIVRKDIAIARERPGCVYYSFGVDLMDENVFRMAEGWVDRAALEEHMSSEQFHEALRDLSEVKVINRFARIYTVSSVDQIELPDARSSG
jgi:quinol monooxygenase YgiN